MTTRRYLVEVYLPASSSIEGVAARARAAAKELREEAPVRYLRAIFVPADESCFLLYEAAAPELALEASRRAGVGGERVAEAIEGVDGDAPDQGGTR
jgi:hypothetical protein